jgi:cytochrome c biogenesis protein CcmG, thiol:disulfide interchange protein DsbE
MPRPALLAIVLAALLPLAGGCRDDLAPPAGDVAASLALPTLDGAAFDPETLRGRPAIVMFWRTGCSYCLNELPILGEVARARDASALAVLIAGNRQEARRLAATFDGTVLVDDGSLRSRYGITGVPYTLVLRSDGTAARAFLGEQSARTLAAALRAVR